jgi:hypothetical protein
VVTVLSPLLFLVVRRLLLPRLESKERHRRTLHPGWVIASPVLVPLAWWVFTSAIGSRIAAALTDTSSVYLGIGNGYESGENFSSNVARRAQISELLDGWAQHPLLGSGMGARLESGFIRSDRRPWMFELQYHQLLFQGGLLAVALTVVVLVLAARGVMRGVACRPEHASAAVVAAVGALAMLITNASNPFLQAVGHWWPLALTLGIANALTREGVDASKVRRDDATSTFTVA